ncbi:hypothetical protein QBK99_12785 [Corticibacterium sp. UT-5YL-CI-8]|nr:hypothetical protein [Tianweitania sp. UT-5YL-CI-8]
MASFIETIVGFLKDNLQGNPAAGDPLPPGKLADIPGIIDKLTQIQLGTSSNGPTDWLETIKSAVQDVELRDTIIVRALQLRAPRVAEALVMAGLVEVRFTDGAVPRAFAFRIAWNKLDAYMSDPGQAVLNTLFSRVQDIDDLKAAQVLTAKLLTAPRELLLMEYAEQGFAALPDPEPAGAVDLIDLVNTLINSPLAIALPFSPPLTGPQLEALVQAARANPAADHLALLGPDVLGANRLDGFGIELQLNDPQAFAAKKLDLGGGWKLSASTTATAGKTFKLVLQNGRIDLATAPGATYDVKLNRVPAGGKTVVGPSDGTRIEIGPLGLGLRFEAGTQGPNPVEDRYLFSIRASAEQMSFVLAMKDLGVLGKILPLPAEIKLSGDIAVSYRQGKGFEVDAGAEAPISLEFPLPVDQGISAGGAGIKLDHVVARLEARPAADGLESRVMLRLGARGELGPVSFSVEGLGGWFGTWGNDAFGFLPPTGISLSLNAGPVTGGGFLTALDGNQFAGGLDLKVMGIGVGAFALFGEAEGAAAFVGVLGIRLPMPGVQIGFGFAITGVGGVVGVNRRADTDVLREQLATGTSATILFCDNPSGNGLAVIGQLPRLFPAEKGVFLIGPTFQISWLGLFKVDAGLFIELPGPRQIFVAGSARLVIGTESAALVYLRADFVGGVDLVKSLIYFDAVLVNSQVLQVFKVTGGVALRIAYGDNGYFLFSIGGFHPSFNPGGLELPALARAGTSASVSIAWLKLENYFALTSNTFQIGAGVEAGVKIGPIAAHGWFRFNALAQFEPFKFTAGIDAGFDVEVKGVSLCGVRVIGTMSGPGPIVVYAKASVKVLFVRITKDVTVRFGSQAGSGIQPITDVLSLIVPELQNPDNTRCEGDDPSVTLKPDAPTAVNGAALVGVKGAIVWEQKRVPFGVDLQRFEGVPVKPGEGGALHRLVIKSDDPAVTPENDWFGVGSFLEMKDSEALNNARFVQAQSGLRLGSGATKTGPSLPCDVKIDLVKLPKRVLFKDIGLVGSYVSPALAGMRGERSGTARPVSGGARLSARQEEWSAVDKAGNTLVSLGSSIQAFSAARSGGGIAHPAAIGAVDLQGVF